MDIDGALGVLGLLLHWRIVLCIAGSTTAAYFAVQSFAWRTGLHCFVIAFLGLGFGAMWEARATNKSTVATAPDSQQTSAAVAGAVAVISGATWGVFSSTSIHSFVAGVFLFVAAAWWWHWYACSRHTWVSGRRAWSCIFLALCAYTLGALGGHHAL